MIISCDRLDSPGIGARGGAAGHPFSLSHTPILSLLCAAVSPGIGRRGYTMVYLIPIDSR